MGNRGSDEVAMFVFDFISEKIYNKNTYARDDVFPDLADGETNSSSYLEKKETI